MDTYSSGEDLVIKTRKPYTITKQRERWTEEEHNRFLEAVKLYGRAWQRIEGSMFRSHVYILLEYNPESYFLCLFSLNWKFVPALLFVCIRCCAEHIGTKTAVQIRSHAQKFFTKLEKEALVKGVPIRQALDIEIPPPRPKRKPSNPYPRKTGVVTPSLQVGAKDGKNLSSVSSYFTGKQILDLEREPFPEKPGGDEKQENAKENQDEGNCSEVLTLFQEAPCTSLSSVDKDTMRTPVAPRNSCTFREFVPMIVSTEDETNESYVTVEPKGIQKLVKLDGKQTTVQDNGTNNTPNFESSNPSLEKLVQGKKTDEMCHPENFGALRSSDIQATQNYPRHVPVHVLNGSLGMSTQNVSSDMSYQESMFHQIGGIHGCSSPFTNPAASATTEHHINASRSSSTHQPFPPFHPLFTPIRNDQDDYRSYLHFSSTFSNLIASTLLQNPAVHAAASFAATFWPPANMEASAVSPLGTLGSFPSRQINPAPSMAAIAAATVAAAAAWWAAHGLLPLCTPFHSGFSCTPASTTATPSDAGLAAAENNDKRENASHDLRSKNQQLNLEYSETRQEQHSASKSPTLSSSDSEESEGAKPNAGLAAADHEKAAAVTELHDSNKTKSRKQVDRSSCGSNTPSSSDVETDALEKHEKDKEESKEPDVSLPAGDSNNRRGRSSNITNDSWKEVSEEGRLAFRALFSREVLPQSFSPPQGKQNVDENASRLDLNSKTWGTCPSHQVVQNNAFLRVENYGEGLLTMELGHGKLKPYRTGFKPYKRCSVEAKESKVANASCQGEEKGPKRIRLEGEAST